MSRDIIPSKDAAFNTFEINVIAAMVLSAVVWGIPNGVITALQGLQTLWKNAYTAYLDPSQKTSGVTKAKNTARKNFVAQLRPAIQQYIQKNSVVTDQQRLNMGIKPADKTRTRVKVPNTTPQIDLANMGGYIVKAFFKQGVDELGVSRRGKPKGVTRCVIAFKAGDPAPASYADCPNQNDASRSPLLMPFAPADAGKKLYVFAHWVNNRNEGGPWTTQVVTIIIA